MDEEKVLCIYASDKVAYAKIEDPLLPVGFAKRGDQTCDTLPDTPRVRELLEQFQNNALVRCKDYSDMIKSLRAQLTAAKKALNEDAK